MDARQQRGMELAATRPITKSKRNNGVWLVPSQSGPGKYTVNIASKQPTCTCPDFEIRNQKCKHIFAVSYAMIREEHSDGSTTVTETLTMTAVRKTYPQNWPAYNAAQPLSRTDFRNSCTTCALGFRSLFTSVAVDLVCRCRMLSSRLRSRSIPLCLAVAL